MKHWEKLPGLSLALVLSKAMEAYVSSGSKEIDFDMLVRSWEAVLLVEKSTPYIVQEKIRISDSIPGEFTTTTYNFKIKSIVKFSIEAMAGMKKIAVHSASDEDNLKDTKTGTEGGPSFGRAFDHYRAKDPHIEDRKEFLIFILHNPKNGWYSFTAHGAM